MTPDRLIELQKQLADHGLTVMLTRNFDSLLLQLARLAQFERLMEGKAEHDKRLSETVKMVRLIQRPLTRRNDLVDTPSQPLEILDIPTILSTVNKELQTQLDNQARIDHDILPAAVGAFTTLLLRR